MGETSDHKLPEVDQNLSNVSEQQRKVALPFAASGKQERLAQRSRELAEFRKTSPFQAIPSEQLVRDDRDGRLTTIPN